MRTWPQPHVPALSGSGHPVLLADSSGELVVAAQGDVASLYVCGITPYDATHVGHAATYVAFDLLVRAWRDAGHQVVHASNVTDVDDPLLERAAAVGMDWRELAAEQIDLFAADMAALRVIPPDVYCGAVETVPEVAHAVRVMLGQGTAYRVPLEPGAGGLRSDLGDVYADLSADSQFGTVAALDGAEMAALFQERGGDPDRAGKRHPLDPLLWRRERIGEPTWPEEVLGSGRPGWHIECAVIARDGLGAGFDVQGGGSDLAFPHHEMSSSHARILTGQAPHLHVHAALVAYQGAKMSKSKGNLVFISQLRSAGVDPMAIRLALVAHHYRQEWEWTDDDLRFATTRLARWRTAFGLGGPDAGPTISAVRRALSHDLDAPAALDAIDHWVAQAATGQGGLDPAQGQALGDVVDALIGVR